MEKIYDFNNIKRNNNFYGGLSGSKIGIKFNNENWILKFPKSTKSFKNVEISYTTSPLSEYLGSHIYESLDIPVHKTLLGIKDGKVVVACKDFKETNEILFEFREIKNEYIKDLEEKIETLSLSNQKGIDIEEIELIMENNSVFLELPNLITRFWDMFVIDTFIGNNDRNNGNWGILKNNENNTIKIAPVYDNGASFSNKLGKNKMKEFLSNDEKFKNTAILSLRCPFNKNGKEINPIKYITSMENNNLNEAILRIVPKINLEKIKEIIYDIPNTFEEIEITNDIQKEFYYKVLEKKYTDILLPTYKKISQIQTNIKEEIENPEDEDEEEL